MVHIIEPLVHFRLRIPSPTRNNLLSSTLNPLHHRKPDLPRTLKMAVTQAITKRPTCPSCSKPVRLCFCNRIRTPGLENSVRVTILQHSLERKHPLNSTRIAKLGLKNLTVTTVSDINYEAQFVIRSLDPSFELGSDRNGLESSGFDEVLADEGTQEPVFEDVDGFNLGKENMGMFGFKEFSRYPEEKNTDLIDNIGSLGEKAEIIHENNEEETVITATIGRYGVISSLTHVWMLGKYQQKSDFDQILASQVAMDALAKGFVVKRIQKEKLELYQEYELKIPQGSVLLFPSEQAIGIDELEAMNFKVRNLIVLDGTWGKAKKMYNENPWLKLLPHLKLDLEKMSLYSGVRRQPKAGYLSTIESIVHALQALGDNLEGLDNLLDVFESMVGDQRRCKDERLGKISTD